MKYFSVTQTCRRLNVRAHVLRYWEKEFEIRVKRNSAGRRIYSEQQVEKLRLIKHLIHREKLTVKGARRQMAKMGSGREQPAAQMNRKQLLLWLKRELLQVRGMFTTDG
ncbi:MAG: MerR family transcriptional regulator [candidate division WOR-3 bacterium]|nr:MAG: MerR family transcriptional regulator [candidate division WOR-3 bacterium]